MIGLALCALGFVAASLLTWRSVVGGLGMVMFAGYFYGIARANFPDSYSHFIFDSAVLGFYLSYFGGHHLRTDVDPRQHSVQRWVYVLIGWTALMFLVPIQHPLIQLVGLRGNCYLLPFVLVGGRLRQIEAYDVAAWMSVLNHIALCFALAEFFLGVPAFYPRNEVTTIIYRSADVAGNALRIPATFNNAHGYGGTMIITLPWLLGAFVQPRLADWQRALILSGMGVAMLGVFLCAARLPLILLGLIAVAATFSGHMRGAIWLVWSVTIAGVAYIVSGEERLQRFMSLQDSDYVISRLEGSVNMGFFELLVTYPFGNGIGAGGTSIPFFLEHLVRDPVGIENEYGRILLEQGAAGLILWIAFILWFLGRRPADRRDSWQFGKILLWFFTLTSFAFAMIGTGLMTSVPGSMLFFLGVGFVTAPATALKGSQRTDKLLETGKAAPAIATVGAPGKI